MPIKVPKRKKKGTNNYDTNYYYNNLTTGQWRVRNPPPEKNYGGFILIWGAGIKNGINFALSLGVGVFVFVCVKNTAFGG